MKFAHSVVVAAIAIACSNGLAEAKNIVAEAGANLRGDGGGEGELNPADKYNIKELKKQLREQERAKTAHVAGVDCNDGENVNSNGCSFITIGGGCVLTVTNCSGEFNFVTLAGGGVLKVPADVTSVSGVTMAGGSCIEAESSSTSFNIITNAGGTIQKDGATCGYGGARTGKIEFPAENKDVEIQIQTNDGDEIDIKLSGSP